MGVAALKYTDPSDSTIWNFMIYCTRETLSNNPDKNVFVFQKFTLTYDFDGPV